MLIIYCRVQVTCEVWKWMWDLDTKLEEQTPAVRTIPLYKLHFFRLLFQTWARTSVPSPINEY